MVLNHVIEITLQALQQRLVTAEVTVEKAAAQIEEIIRAANLDMGEMSRVLASINEMISAKDSALQDVMLLVAKLKKNFNDAFDTYAAKFKELGIPQSEVEEMGFVYEDLLPGTSLAPSGLLHKA